MDKAASQEREEMMGDLIPILRDAQRESEKAVKRLKGKPMETRVGQARAKGRAEAYQWAIEEIEARLQDGRLVDMD